MPTPRYPIKPTLGTGLNRIAFLHTYCMKYAT